ncbi:VOC family protein [Shewanella sp. 1_MG-2023]|uniref:VOC family protein n=1 Tax=unclassified Shewanella TaxID=196818 RepID=UPI0026E1F42C|nr:MULTISPECIES: VOC family protein [unclassified Shewanella]MDO6612040.1 VOC family protein [Shewanella sp. 7_MG-2023]MDO6771884.1 VOC family protein [Shewanella sp. 2_MG-2023]MDO6794228.1 VOC family protein [Shewanella sp. 1_MG-2023]
MEQITRINHYGLRVKDFEVSKAFYAQLGFNYIAGPIGPEPVAIIEHPSGVNINFILNAADTDTNVLMDIPTKHTGYTHVALEVTSAAAVITKLAELNIPLSGEPIKHVNGTSFFIRDPDRNVVEFIEYKGLDIH